jgi:hypothetical protein
VAATTVSNKRPSRAKFCAADNVADTDEDDGLAVEDGGADVREGLKGFCLPNQYINPLRSKSCS